MGSLLAAHGLLFIALHELVIMVAFLVGWAHGLEARELQQLQRTG